MSGSTRDLICPRWWLALSIAFAGFTLVLSTLAMYAFLGLTVGAALEGFRGSSTPWAFKLCVVAIEVGLAFLLSWIVAIAVEERFRSRGNLDHSPRWSWRSVVTALLFMASFAVVPILWSSAFWPFL